jgi:hypothetical protein
MRLLAQFVANASAHRLIGAYFWWIVAVAVVATLGVGCAEGFRGDPSGRGCGGALREMHRGARRSTPVTIGL